MTNPVDALFEWGPMMFTPGYTVTEGGAPAEALAGGATTALVAALPPSLIPAATALASMAGVPVGAAGAVAASSVAPLAGACAAMPAARFVSVVACDRGAGTLGFAGTSGTQSGGQPAGLTLLAGDEFGDGPRIPMLPASWGTGLVGAPNDGGSVSV
ncbi:hypothetical protein [Mycobacterium decipiens]|uniref:PPW family C-terminal domain-containing PPE protein n=1 Tax=Mycobacterium decipiens TaxID=1430326 RepID=UPI001F60EE61|nr:hypothetical protein [Mycobacterium decipiens]